MKEKDKQKKLPIDAKLLSDAVIELNISRRSVGLYPSDHPITKNSIDSAYNLLKKLFELRHSITLGVAKNVLMVDEYTLDRKNPVFIEFASAMYLKGISAITFYAGLEEKELLLLQELITDKDRPAGQELVELKECKELKHIRLSPLDVSKLRFVKGKRKETEGSGQSVWEEYVYGLIEGTLADEDAAGVLISVPPEEVARILDSRPPDTPDAKKGYDRVITTYLSKKGRKGLNRASLNRFMTLVENLSPAIKEQFLLRAVKNKTLNEKETEEIFEELTPEDVERMMEIFQKQSVLPQSLRNFIDKFSATKKKESITEMLHKGSSHVHDIEITEDMMKLFEEDKYGEFVDDKYQKDLEKMLKVKRVNFSTLLRDVQNALQPEILDSAFSEVLLELISSKNIKHEDCQKLLKKISELTDVFLETGRLDEVLQIHNTIYSQMLTGNYKDEFSDMMKYYFRSEQFISRFLDVLNIWGRDKRDSAIKLVKVLKLSLMIPIFDVLNKEERSSQRKFYLSILSQMGKDVIQEAGKRLSDDRWYVVRNMIYLIRECRGKEYLKKIGMLAQHENKQVRVEALKAIVFLGDPDALSHIRVFLNSKIPELRGQAIKLCGTYRIKESVPYLCEILGKQVALLAQQHYKLMAVQALGKIGDPVVLETLKKLYKSRTLLYKGASNELRLEIIKSLKNYPFEKAGPILELAFISRNKEMRSLAKEMLSGGWDV